MSFDDVLISDVVAVIDETTANHNHDKYIDTSKFNTLATNVLMQDWHKEI